LRARPPGQYSKFTSRVYIEKVLVPNLRRGQVVVKDNLSTHKDERGRPLVRSVGGELLYLPPYSPDFSPIEESL